MCAWAEISEGEFSKGKCRILHLGKNNPMHHYRLGKKDLVVLMGKFIMSQQYSLVTKKASRILWCIKKHVASRLR